MGIPGPGVRARRFLLPGTAALACAWLLSGVSSGPRPVSVLVSPAPVVLAQEQQPCGCPKMPVVATSDNPAKGRVVLETNLSEIEKLFSNRYEMYAGGWDDAMVAWAHELDPSGALKIWDRPAPAKKQDAPALEEGLITGALLRVVTPRDADTRFADSPSVTAQQNMGQMSEKLFHTLARIHKYGEPQAGLRTAVLAVLRFFGDTLARLPPEATGSSPRGGLLREIGSGVQALGGGYVAGGIPDGPHLATRGDRESFGGQLPLDALDLAYAGLDFFWATDDARGDRIVRAGGGMLGILGSVASGWSTFGAKNEGAAQEAVSCRAYSVLLALLDTQVQGTREARTALAGDLKQALFNSRLTVASEQRVDLPEVRALTAAVVAGGMADQAEADERVGDFYSQAVGYRREADREKVEAVRTLRMLTTYAGGQRDTFRAYMAQRVADVIAATQREAAEQHREPEEAFLGFLELWNSTGATEPPTGDFSCGPGEGESEGDVFLYAVTNKGLQQVLHPYIGVPMVIEAHYDPPEGATEKMLQVSLGGHSQVMTFKRFDPKGYIYRSDPFVPGGLAGGSTVSPLPGDVR